MVRRWSLLPVKEAVTCDQQDRLGIIVGHKDLLRAARLDVRPDTRGTRCQGLWRTPSTVRKPNGTFKITA